MSSDEFDAGKKIDEVVRKVEAKGQTDELVKLFFKLRREIASAIVQEQKARKIEGISENKLKEISKNVRTAWNEIIKIAKSAHKSGFPAEGPMRELLRHVAGHQKLAQSWNEFRRLSNQKLSAHLREDQFILDLTYSLGYELERLTMLVEESDRIVPDWVFRQAGNVLEKLNEVMKTIKGELDLSISEREIDELLQDWRKQKLGDEKLLEWLQMSEHSETSGSSMLDQLAGLRPFENDYVKFSENEMLAIKKQMVKILKGIEEFRELVVTHNLAEFKLQHDFSEIENEMKGYIAKIKQLVKPNST